MKWRYVHGEAVADGGGYREYHVQAEPSADTYDSLDVAYLLVRDCEGMPARRDVIGTYETEIEGQFACRAVESVLW